MGTAHLLTVCQHAPWGFTGGIPTRGWTCLGRVPTWGSTCPRGCTFLGGLPGQVLPPVDRQTHVKTSTLQTSFSSGNNRKRLTDFNKNACACGKYHWLATPVPWLGVRQLSSEGSSVAIALTLMLGINWPQWYKKNIILFVQWALIV